MTDAATRFAAVEALKFSEVDRVALHTLGVQALPVAQALEAVLKVEFDKKHGAQCDTPRWRQFQAAYQVAFPAADLDHARAACKLLSEIIAFAENEAARAAGASILLMRGPAGIGKTHTTIDATKERVAAGRAAIAILGQEITAGHDPWSVVAKKLEISPTATKAEVIGVLATYAEKTGAPFVVIVDAVNETPDRKRWRSWLPQLTADLVGQPIKVLLTCRDIFVDDTLGATGAGLVSFTHTLKLLTASTTRPTPLRPSTRSARLPRWWPSPNSPTRSFCIWSVARRSAASGRGFPAVRSASPR
ncbi:hypothetical protein HB770_02295 [Rhizobium leguminosarum bv. viciae]|uniref:ATP-binding protein n=1 Tax=Rhizobium leguminosarum bv. viciae TaxID=387 RepID=A0A7G6RHG7_RHILV|nr:hypothetical protein HB770_02295 [Rhizobium leguminosarum bv. viciae]